MSDKMHVTSSLIFQESEHQSSQGNIQLNNSILGRNWGGTEENKNHTRYKARNPTAESITLKNDHSF